MILALDASLKVSILMLAALGAAGLLRRRSAALRHWVLGAAMICAAATPLLTPLLPAWHVGLPARGQAGHAVAPQPTGALVIASSSLNDDGGASFDTPRAGRVMPSPASVAAAIWIAGTSASLLMLLAGLVRLRWLERAATPVAGRTWHMLASDVCGDAGVRRPVALLQTDHPALLVTWGIGSPRIMLPLDAATWTLDRARIVLRHELAHIARADWAVQMVGEIVRAVYWFNPLVWIVCRRLRHESERACDDAVLNAGVDAAEYASHLVDLARTLTANRRVYLPAPAMARPSSLEGRIGAMLNPHTDRSPLTRSARLAIAFVLLCLTTTIAGLAAQRFSTFSGTLLDQTNAYLPGVGVTLTNSITHAEYKVRTDSTGHFEFVGLPDGQYGLAAEEPGFAALIEPITIAGQNLVRTIQLQLGSLHETLTVTSGEPAAPIDPAARLESRRWALERSRKAADQCAANGGGAGGVGGNILQPTKVVHVRPLYPDSLQSAKIGGVVTLDALIGTDGTVRDVRVVSGVNPDLDSAAIDAVRQWEFSTTMLNCTPVEVRMGVTANFVAKP
jgi:TonB family protein